MAVKKDNSRPYKHPNMFQTFSCSIPASMNKGHIRQEIYITNFFDAEAQIKIFEVQKKPLIEPLYLF